MNQKREELLTLRMGALFNKLARGGLLTHTNGSIPTGSEQEMEQFELDEVVSKHMRRWLKRTGGKVHGPGGAAELLGVNPSTLRNRMNKLGIQYGRKK